MSERNNKPKIIVILGPTASGKSDIAVEIARKFNGEIISADSRQVYKGLDIGTGKITKKEMKGVAHHLLDVISPHKRYTASDFLKTTKKTIIEIIDRKKIPIVCGGTGFYIDALLGDKQIPEVPPNPKLRKELENKTAEELFDVLKKLDPERAKNIDAKNPRRLVRAIEICKALGKVPMVESRSLDYEVLKIGIAPITPSPTLTESVHSLDFYIKNLNESCKNSKYSFSHPSSYNKRKGQEKNQLSLSESPLYCCKREDLEVSYFINEKILKERINKRIDKWFKMGLLKEVENLHTRPTGEGLSWKRMAEIGLEYKLVANFLKLRLRKLVSRPNLDTRQMRKEIMELKEKMRTETWQYAKRQMTYFKKTPNVIWFDPNKINLIEKEINNFLK